MSTATAASTIKDIEVSVDNLNVGRAADVFNEHGCLVVRGLLKPYVTDIARDVDSSCDQALSLLDRAEKIVEGWRTPDGTLFIPAPPNYKRDKQIMVLAFNYQTCGAFFQSGQDKTLLNILEGILGPNIELFGNGQCLVKEPVGGHPKHLHQDSAYFEHKYMGPVGVLTYVVPTNLANGALHVVPGSFKLGQLKHIDTFSHLGLDPQEWPWERATPVLGEPGDSIFFHYRCIHGSKENHSDKRRPVFIHRYRRPDDYVIVGATTTANRAEAEKKASQAKKAGQRGTMVRGFRPYSDEG